jgi:hypothetical protein
MRIRAKHPDETGLHIDAGDVIEQIVFILFDETVSKKPVDSIFGQGDGDLQISIVTSDAGKASHRWYSHHQQEQNQLCEM